MTMTDWCGKTLLIGMFDLIMKLYKHKKAIIFDGQHIKRTPPNDMELKITPCSICLTDTQTFALANFSSFGWGPK